jgi:transcriptional regulator with XRE-family HTH domain
MEDAIRFEIDRALYTRGFTRTDLARRMGVPSSTVKRRMEGSAPVGGIDELVAAASEIVDLTPISLWRKALSLWQSNGDSPTYWANLRRGQARLVKAGPSNPPDDAGEPDW